MVSVHPITSQNHHRHRLRLRRHCPPETVPCAVRHRTQHAMGPPGRDHDQPDRAMDHSSRPEPDDAARRYSAVPVLDPRRSRTIHTLLRHRSRGSGIAAIRIPPRSPQANAFAERWVRTLRHELLDRTIIWNETQLRHLLEEYIEHYNTHRPHRSLHERAPNDVGEVVAIGQGHPIQRNRLQRAHQRVPHRSLKHPAPTPRTAREQRLLRAHNAGPDRASHPKWTTRDTR